MAYSDSPFKRGQILKEHVVWTDKNWFNVPFSDKRNFMLFGADRKHYVQVLNREVHKKVSERWRRKCHGFGGCFLWQELLVIQLHDKVKAHYNQNLLQQHAAPSLTISTLFFMQDNTPVILPKVTGVFRVRHFLY